MFRHAISYLAVAVLFAASSLGAATDNHVTAVDENKAKKLPLSVNEKTVGKQRALQGIAPVFWTKVGQTLMIKDKSAYDEFGYATDISADGSVVAVGAGSFDDGNSTDAGLVQVYMLRNFKKGPRWVPKGEPIIGDEEDEAGWALKLAKNGNVIAIGSDDSNDDAGHVKVYQWWAKQKKWVQLGQTIVGDHPDDESGWGIDLSEDGLTLVIGSPEYDNGGDDSADSGLTKIFTYDKAAKEWILKGNPIIGVNFPNTTDTYYGWTVGLDRSGDRVITGGPFDSNEEIEYTGAVMVFDYNSENGDWDQVGETIFGNGTETEFGIGVAMSKDGDTIAVSAGCYYYCEYNDRIDDDFDGNHNDYVHIYNLRGGVWTLIGELFPEDFEFGFGQSISISDDGTKLGVGAASYDHVGESEMDNGYAKVYQYNGDFDWTQVGQDLLVKDNDDGETGSYIQLSGDGMNLIVGAHQAGKTYKAGLANVYKIADDEETSPVAGCEDSMVPFKLNNGKNYSCKRVKPNQCKNDSIASMCPLKCKKCLDNACNDGALKVKVANKKFVDCESAPKNFKYPKSNKSTCKPGVATACRKTCHSKMYDLLCPYKPAATRSPTASPTEYVPCEEDGSDLFFWFKKKNGDEVFRKCSWLSDNTDKIDKICLLNKYSENGTPPAKEVCRITCGECETE